MTNEEREEALAIMNVIIHMIEKQYDNDRVEKAVDTAIAALKAEPCEDAVSREHLLSEIDDLMQSPWFNNGKDDDIFTHYGYVERKEAVEVVRDLCIKTEPPVTPKPTECEDCVSIEAVMQTLYDYGCESEIQDAISKLPLVTPKKRTGK